MKEIVKKGNEITRKMILGERKYIKKCWNCKCKFTYQSKDMKWSMLHECDYVECPECDTNLYITFRRKYRGTK